MVITSLQSGLRPSFPHHLCCVLVLYMTGGTYSLKWTSNDRFFLILFMANFIFFRVSASCLPFSLTLVINLRLRGLLVLLWDQIVYDIFVQFPINCLCFATKFPINPNVTQAKNDSLRSVLIIYRILWQSRFEITNDANFNR